MVRIHLSGRLTLEADAALLGPDDLPGQQGRAAFAFLVGQRHHPVPRTALAEALWPRSRPTSWEGSVNSLVSKLRSFLGRAGLDGAETIRSVGGCYELHLPRATWVDHEVLEASIHEAEAALRDGAPRAAYGPSAVAHHIARRPFLPAEEGRWFEERRDMLRGILLRALECRAEVYLWNEEYTLAVEAAREAVRMNPFRETAYRLLMRAQSASGNAAEALRTYERCRTVIADELGVPPSPETRALHRELLRAL